MHKTRINTVVRCHYFEIVDTYLKFFFIVPRVIYLDDATTYKKSYSYQKCFCGE